MCSDAHQLWLTMGIAMSNPSFRAAEPQARPSELTKHEIGGFRVIRQRSDVFHLAAQDKFDLSGGAVTTTNPDGCNVNPPSFPLISCASRHSVQEAPHSGAIGFNSLGIRMRQYF